MQDSDSFLEFPEYPKFTFVLKYRKVKLNMKVTQ